MSGEWSQTPLIPPERQVQVRTRILLRSFDPATHVTARMAPRAKEESGIPQKEDAVLSKHHNLQLLVTRNILNVWLKGPQFLENNKNRHVDSFLCIYVFSLYTYRKFILHNANTSSHFRTLPYSCLIQLLLFTVCSTVATRSRVWFRMLAVWMFEVSLSKTLKPGSHLKLYLLCINVCTVVSWRPHGICMQHYIWFLYLLTVVSAKNKVQFSILDLQWGLASLPVFKELKC